MKDLTLIIENVRTFRGRHEISIRPLTILTGENSSGKTTLLALFSTVCDQESFPLRPDFNKPPYNLGNYETIASYDPALDTQERDFSLGFLRPDTDTHLIKSAEARYGAAGGHIRLSSFEARGKNLEFSLNQGITDRFKGTITIDFSGKASRLPFSLRQGGQLLSVHWHDSCWTRPVRLALRTPRIGGLCWSCPRNLGA